MIPNLPIQELDSCLSLSRRAGVHRAVIMRMISSGELLPDAWLIQSTGRLPLFSPARAVDVVRYQKFSRRSKST